MFGCCNCGTAIKLEEHVNCSDCGGLCCSEECLKDHECEPDGDMEEEEF